jgi:hypothetical protein
MCNPASIVIASNGKKAFWSRLTDSHESIVCEHNLVESVANKICIVRVELVPPDGDMTRPLKEWIFRTDQDLLPKWYDPKSAEKVCRGELKDWFASKVFLKGEHEIKEGLVYALESARVVARDSASVVARNSARVKAWDSASVEARNSASVEAWESSSVVAWESSSVVARNSASVEAWDSARVEARNSARVEAWDSASVEARDSATIVQVHSTTKILLSGWAVNIDRSGGKPVIHTA